MDVSNDTDIDRSGFLLSVRCVGILNQVRLTGHPAMSNVGLLCTLTPKVNPRFVIAS